MEDKCVLVGCGVLMAFCGGLASGMSFMGNFRLRFRNLTWYLRNGIAWAKPLARFLLRQKHVADLMQEALWHINVRGIYTTKEALTSLCIAILCLLGAGVGLASRSLVCAVAVTLCLCSTVVVRLNAARGKRCNAMREAVPDILRSMDACFRAGLSLLQTFQHLSKETNGALRVVFEQVAHRMEMGCGIQEALGLLRSSSLIPELSFIAVALDIQHQSGGSVKKVLDSARKTVEDKLYLSRSLRVQTAQAKLSAQIVSVMPFVLVALLSFVDRSFLRPFFSSFYGLLLLVCALGMQVIGILAVRRLLAVRMDA